LEPWAAIFLPLATATAVRVLAFRAASGLLHPEEMRILEARFRPEQGSPFLIVGHLVWLGSLENEEPVVHPAPSLVRDGSSGTFVSKLEYLVSSTAPDCFDRLQLLRSRFWSFVEVAPSALLDAP